MNSPTSKAIELDDVSFSYPEDRSRSVLTIPHWEVPESEHVFVHGPSGSGKSTLLNLLSGMLVPDSGLISVNDSRLDKMTARQRDNFRANQIGYVFQQFNLIPYLNSMDNIRLARYLAGSPGGASADDGIESLLSELNIEAQEWGKPVSRLSMGQQQRVAIARALINKPKILIADEPTSSLDQANRDTFMSILMEVANVDGITLVFVSHDLSLKSYFSRVEAMSEINQGGA